MMWIGMVIGLLILILMKIGILIGMKIGLLIGILMKIGILTLMN